MAPFMLSRCGVTAYGYLAVGYMPSALLLMHLTGSLSLVAYSLFFSFRDPLLRARTLTSRLMTSPLAFLQGILML